MPNPNEYATTADVKARYSDEFLKRVTNFTGVDDGTAVIDAKIDLAVLDASDLMDGFLQSRYVTPVVNAPDHFLTDCVKIAVKLLIERKGYDAESSEGNHVEAAKEVLKKYFEISRGKLSLGIPLVGGGTTTQTRIKFKAPAKKWTEETLDKYSSPGLDRF